jgi:hypothetical protein
MVFARSDFVSVQHPVSAIEPSITTSKSSGIVIFISGNFALTCGKRLHGENCAESLRIWEAESFRSRKYETARTLGVPQPLS